MGEVREITEWLRRIVVSAGVVSVVRGIGGHSVHLGGVVPVGKGTRFGMKEVSSTSQRGVANFA